MCPCHDPYMLVPAGMTPEEAADLRDQDRDGYLQQSRASMIRIAKAMNQFLDASCIVFEYGTFVRKEAADAGLSPEEAFRYPGCIARYIRPMFLEGRGPFVGLASRAIRTIRNTSMTWFSASFRTVP